MLALKIVRSKERLHQFRKVSISFLPPHSSDPMPAACLVVKSVPALSYAQLNSSVLLKCMELSACSVRVTNQHNCCM